MATKQIGLKAVLDVKQFNQGVSSFIRSTEMMNRATVKLASTTAREMNDASKSASGFYFSWSRVKEIISGVLVIDVFRTISRELRNVSQEAMEAVGNFQALDIQLKAILARDFAREFGGTVGEALPQVAKSARELLLWIREVAVTTPFSVESLTRTLAYGQAFGFTTEQAKRLTLATGNFTAGMGLGNEVMERIIYNFGQMLASGRVLGRELRDLANNMVPIRDVTDEIAKISGKSSDEIRKAFKDGEISASQFISAFVTIAERDFPGAMDNMSRTIQGVSQNFRDFIHTVLGLELLGPVVGKITAILYEKLNSLFEPEVMKGFTIAGIALAKVFDMLALRVSYDLVPAFRNLFAAFGLSIPTAYDLAGAMIKITLVIDYVVKAISAFINELTKLVKNITSKFSTTFDQLSSDAYSWGANIIISFADGMASVIKVVLDTIANIARAIANLLSAHSPPRILPQLFNWGRKAMDTYLEGWASADFSAFKDIASTLTGFIRSISFKMDEKDVVPRILGTRDEIAKAVAEVRNAGSVTQETLDRILRSSKASSQAFREFIKATLEFQGLEMRNKELDKFLDFDPSKGPAKIFGALVTDLDDLASVAQKFGGTLKEELLGYVDSLVKSREATKALEDAQADLNSISQKYKTLLEELERQQNALSDAEEDFTRIRLIDEAVATGLLTTEELTRLELEKRGMLLRRQIRDTRAEADAAEETAENRVDAIKEEQERLQELSELQKDSIQQSMEIQLASVKEILEVSKGRIDIEIETNNLIKEQIELLDRLSKAKSGGGGGGPADPWDIGLDLEGWSEGIQNSITDALPDIQAAMDTLEKELRNRFNTFVARILLPFSGVKEKFKQVVADIGSSFTSITQNPGVQAFLASVYNLYFHIRMALSSIKTFIDQNGDDIIASINTFINGLIDNFDMSKSIRKDKSFDISKMFSMEGTLSFGGIADVINKFADSISKIAASLVTNGPQIVENLNSLLDSVLEGIGKIQTVWTFIKDELVPTIVDKMPLIAGALAGAGTAIILFSNALTIFNAVLGLPYLAGFASGFIGALPEALGALASVAGPALAPLAPIAAVMLLIAVSVGALVTAVAKDSGGIREWFSSLGGTISKTLGPSMTALSETIKGELLPAWDELKVALEPLIKIFKLVGDTWLRGFAISFMVGASIVLSVVIGVINGLIRAVSSIVRTVKSIINSIRTIFEGAKLQFEAFKLFIIGIFTGDFSKLKDAQAKMWAGIKKIYTGTLTAIWSFVTGIFKAILVFIGGFIEGVITFFTNLYKELVGESIIPDMLSDMIDAFTGFFSDSLEKIKTWVSNIIKAITDKASEFVSAGVKLVTEFMAGMKSKFFGEDGVITNFGKWISETATKIAEKANLDEFVKGGKELVGGLIEGIKTKFEGVGGVYEKVKGFISSTVTEANTKVSEWTTLGKNLIQGIINGFVNGSTLLYNAIKEVVLEALGIAQKETEVESPSRVYMRLAFNWMKGMALGIEDGKGQVFKAMYNTVSDIANYTSGMQIPLPGVARSANSYMSQNGLPVRGIYGSNSSSISTDNSVHLELNANYKNYQSESDIYYDVRAAMASAGLIK